MFPYNLRFQSTQFVITVLSFVVHLVGGLFAYLSVCQQVLGIPYCDEYTTASTTKDIANRSLNEKS